MLKIGLTSGTLITMPQEANNAYAKQPRSKLVEKETTSGDINVTATGRTRSEIKLEYENLELSEYDLVKQYCHPYVIDRFYVQISNTLGTLIFDGFAYLIMNSEKIDYDAKQYSFSLVIKSI
jgi:hypothetical protein